MVTSWSAHESHQRALHTRHSCSLTDYISHHSLPGLISTHYHIHLYLIFLFSSPYISLVHPITRCEVLYVVALHFWAFSLVFLSHGLLDFLPVSWITLVPLTPACFVLFVCLFGLSSCAWPSACWVTILDNPLINAAFGSLTLVSWSSS